ncbi:hypothetical protein OVS_02115 [Mycoplasma ovis str. Michigan]|uniref:Uncharacterized protein n=1 Tax=Mycoplasma ovis str. Michigan TaxID=1415773 RepID=A0ABM5P1L4_9MOLU|nr:hypothetical protein [Mycoplasma ovis]AHC40285.1 hypothetical protein OVS_02115 [Mycoplasma ovis str. Michigan]
MLSSLKLLLVTSGFIGSIAVASLAVNLSSNSWKKVELFSSVSCREVSGTDSSGGDSSGKLKACLLSGKEGTVQNWNFKWFKSNTDTNPVDVQNITVHSSSLLKIDLKDNTQKWFTPDFKYFEVPSLGKSFNSANCKFEAKDGENLKINCSEKSK